MHRRMLRPADWCFFDKVAAILEALYWIPARWQSGTHVSLTHSAFCPFSAVRLCVLLLMHCSRLARWA